jgi:hypothetical protein
MPGDIEHGLISTMDKITKKPEVEFKEFVADVCANHFGGH